MRYAIAMLLASTVSAGASENAIWSKSANWETIGNDETNSCITMTEHPTEKYTLGIALQGDNYNLIVGGVSGTEGDKPIRTKAMMAKKDWWLFGQDMGNGTILFPALTHEFMVTLAETKAIGFYDLKATFMMDGSADAILGLIECTKAMKASEPPTNGNQPPPPPEDSHHEETDL